MKTTEDIIKELLGTRSVSGSWVDNIPYTVLVEYNKPYTPIMKLYLDGVAVLAVRGMRVYLKTTPLNHNDKVKSLIIDVFNGLLGALDSGVKRINDGSLAIRAFRDTVMGESWGLSLGIDDKFIDMSPDIGELFLNLGLTSVRPQHLDINFLDFAYADPTKISYIPDDRLSHFGGDYYNQQLRRKYCYMARPGKLLRRIFPKIPPHILENVSNILKSDNTNTEIKLLDPCDIPGVYSAKTAPTGTIGNSCMNNAPSAHFEIYNDLCKGILTAWDGDVLVARALVWELTGDITFVDRIYFDKDFRCEQMTLHAQSNGWWTKRAQSYTDKCHFVKPDGEIVTKNFSVEYNKDDYSSFPYMDTFTYGDDFRISNLDLGCFTFESTDGGYMPEEDRCWSEYNGAYISEDEAVWVAGVGDYFYPNQVVTIGFEYYYHGDCVELRDGDYALERDAVDIGNGRTEEWILAEDSIYDEVDDRDIHIDDSVELNDGRYTHTENTIGDDITGEIILHVDKVALKDGRWTHIDNTEKVGDTYELIAELV